MDHASQPTTQKAAAPTRTGPSSEGTRQTPEDMLTGVNLLLTPASALHVRSRRHKMTEYATCGGVESTKLLDLSDGASPSLPKSWFACRLFPVAWLAPTPPDSCPAHGYYETGASVASRKLGCQLFLVFPNADDLNRAILDQ